MRIDKEHVHSTNEKYLQRHRSSFQELAERLEYSGIDVEGVISEMASFRVAIPSWALGAGGTRFGRFSFGGEPATLHQKLDDVAIIDALTSCASAISLHIPWDIPEDASATAAYAASLGIEFDAVNSNTFQDQLGQNHSYKFGSLCHTEKAVRDLAIEHTLEVVRTGDALGSKSITIWLADGASFPGQMNFRRALDHTRDSLQRIYREMPEDWKMLIEYKPYEPNFYATVINDWGTSYHLAQSCGERAFTLVDLGHHLPNTNIEQIVATLAGLGKLGGFHFNDSKYGDDDLTVGSVKPYQLYLIFCELIEWMKTGGEEPAWMIDASHNLKDPLEDLIQSLEAIQTALAKALILDTATLDKKQLQNDPAMCQEILKDAYETDVRPLLREVRLRSGAALDPITAYRELQVRHHLIRERGSTTRATGL